MSKPTDVVTVSMPRALWASLLTIYGMGWDEQNKVIQETVEDYMADDRADWEKEQAEGEEAEKLIVAALGAGA